MTYHDTAKWLLERLPKPPECAIILGTGLSDMADDFHKLISIPYSEIPGFPVSTAPSHKGNLILAELAGKTVLFLQGRIHYYEGYSMQEVTFPTRVLAAMQIKCLILTNAAGSLRKELTPGSIVQITDHMNFMGINPLIGQNDDKQGERFPSMNDPYDPDYRHRANEISAKLGIKVHKGIYLAVTGPSLETKAECAAFADWGADLVGMSTVPETITARHAGMRVLGYSIVTNYSNLFHSDAHSQEEIRINAGKASQDLKAIIKDFVDTL
jgi:purine-nucleoside phosphorylase